MPSLKVTGMSCQHCVASVTQALENLNGITSISIDLETGQVDYETDGSADVSEIKSAISTIGFTPED